jgi:hypothetical protein
MQDPRLVESSGENGIETGGRERRRAEAGLAARIVTRSRRLGVVAERREKRQYSASNRQGTLEVSECPQVSRYRQSRLGDIRHARGMASGDLLFAISHYRMPRNIIQRDGRSGKVCRSSQSTGKVCEATATKEERGTKEVRRQAWVEGDGGGPLVEDGVVDLIVAGRGPVRPNDSERRLHFISKPSARKDV